MENALVPKQEHIDRLMLNPQEAYLFDEKYGTGAASKYLKVVETTEEEKEDKQPVKGLTRNALIGAKEGIRETLETLEKLGDLAEEKIPLGGFAFGSDAKNGFIDYLNPEEYKKKIGGDLQEDESMFQQAADWLPESAPAEGVVGNLTRGVSQFVTGFIGGGQVLRNIGWAKKGYNIGRMFVQGGIADFAVFDEHEARLSDFIIEAFPEAHPEFLEYMAANENDSFVEGKMKNVLEGLVLGGTAETLLRVLKLFRGTRKRVDLDDMEGAKKFAEKEAKNIDEAKVKADNEVDEVIQKTKGKRGIPDEKVTKKAKEIKFSQKALNDSDFFKNVKSLIKKIRLGEADVEDLADINYNINFVKDVDDAASIIRAVAKEVNKVTKEFDDVKTHDMVWKEADNLLKSPNEALQKAIQLAKETDSSSSIVLAHRLIVNGMLKKYQVNLRLTELAQSRNMKEVGKVLESDLDKSLLLLRDVIRLDKQIGRNTGRALEIRKVLVGSSTKGEKSIQKLLDEAEYRPEEIDTKEGIKKFHEKARKAKDKKHILQQIKAVQEGIGINKVNKVFINALLSNPKTHAINITSNTLMALIRPLEQYIGGVITRDQSARIEAISTAAGLIKYFKESWIMAKRAFDKSDSILDTKNFKVDVPEGLFTKNKQGISGAASTLIESPTRFLSSADELFKQLQFRSKVYGQAVAEGLRKGLSRKQTLRTTDGRKYSELDEFVEKRFDEAFLPSGAANEKKFKTALEYAQENTFTKGLGQGTIGKGVQSMVNQVPIMRQITPFIRTPVNIMRATWDRTPLFNLARKQFVKELNSPDKAIVAAAKGKIAMGISLYASAISLVWAGKITGGVPKDKYLRRQKFDTGWRPYSFKFGDTYYSYERLDPFGQFFGLVADIATIMNEVTEDERDQLAEAHLLAIMNQMDIQDYAEIGYGSIGAIAKNISSKTYLKSLSDFVGALDSGEWARYGKTKLGSFVPNIVKGVANDPLYRELRTLTDTLKTRVGLYGNVDPSYNALGEVRSKGQSFWESFLLPYSTSEDVDDTAIKEFDRLGVSFAPASHLQGNNKNIDLTQFTNGKYEDGKFTKGDKNAWVRFNEILGSSDVRAEIERMIKSDKYKHSKFDKPIDEELDYTSSRVKALKAILTKHKKRVMKQLLQEGYITKDNLNLKNAFHFDNKNQKRADRGLDLLPIN